MSSEPPDIVLDTNVLADFLSQYFDSRQANRGAGRFQPRDTLTSPLVRRLNRVTAEYQAIQSPSILVVASSLAFVELGRQWDEIVCGRFSLPQIRAFIRQHPEWFLVAAVDSDLVSFFNSVPAGVWVCGKHRPIEWTDAVHVATTLSRGDAALLATTDQRLEALPVLQDRLARQ